MSGFMKNRTTSSSTARLENINGIFVEISDSFARNTYGRNWIRLNGGSIDIDADAERSPFTIVSIPAGSRSAAHTIAAKTAVKMKTPSAFAEEGEPAVRSFFLSYSRTPIR